MWALVLGGAVGLSSWMAHRDARAQLLSNLRGVVEQDARVIQLRLETWLRTFQEDTRSTSQSPVLAAFLKSRETEEESLWRGMAEGEFRAAFAGKPAYFQMRLLEIGGENDGHEILRLDRHDGRLVVTPSERLQQKSGRAYYQEALSVPDDAIYFSKINLNRDFGGITEPHIPTIRAAVRISTVSAPPAMLIINADLRALFQEIDSLSSPTTEVRLADGIGDYVLHPSKEALFASDLGRSHELGEGEVGALAFEEEIPLGGWPERSLTLQVSLPESRLQAALRQSSRRGVWATLLATLGGASGAILIALPFTRRLRRLSSAMREFDVKEGADPVPQPAPTRDEIGIALERFREMASKVRQHVEDLQKARDDADEANAAKETFLAVMSHEIRTPMNAVIGLIRALERNHPPSHQQPILTSLRASSSNLMTLLNTALDYTRLREGAIDYTSEIFDAAAVVREVADALKPSVLAKQLQLTMDLPESLAVSGDSLRFRQVVNNLLSNAVKFTEQGGVSVSLAYVNDCLECKVADSGPGIALEDQERIFTPFFSLRHSEAGAGLGLSVSKQLIVEQGGELRVHSQPEEGSEFTILLPYPLAPASRLDRSVGSSPRPLPCRGLKILYVEDLLSNQEVMALTLEPTGVDLVCVDTAAKALALCETRRFDLVMVDLQLPDMPGDELARRVLAKNAAMPILAVTAQSSARTDGRIRDAGIRAVILKPFTEERVFDLICEHTRPRLMHALKEIHPHEPKRVSQLAQTMVEELRTAAKELQRAAQLEDWEEAKREFRAIRHKLTTTVAHFSLEELQGALDELVEAPEFQSTLVERAINLLNEAAVAFES